MSAFQLVYSHPRFHLVHKAPGLGFHREGDTPGLMDLLREALPGDALWPVHRLDKGSSGVLVLGSEIDGQPALMAMVAPVGRVLLSGENWRSPTSQVTKLATGIGLEEQGAAPAWPAPNASAATAPRTALP